MGPAFITGAILPRSGLCAGATSVCTEPARYVQTTYAPMEILASKHARLKAAKLKNRRRPKKHRPSDINRKPPPFNVDPLHMDGLPEIYTILSEEESVELDTKTSVILTADRVKAIEDAAAEVAAAEAREAEEKRLSRKAQSAKDKIKAKEVRREKWIAFKAEREERIAKLKAVFEEEVKEFSKKYHGKTKESDESENAEKAVSDDAADAGENSEIENSASSSAESKEE